MNSQTSAQRAGKTARMMARAIKLAVDGHKVAVVVRDGSEVRRVCREFLSAGPVPNLGIFPATCPAALRGHRFNASFIDDAVRLTDRMNCETVLAHAVTPAPLETPPVKPFDPTKPVKTRSGYPARIVCTDAKKGDRPILALVDFGSGNEDDRHYRADGTHPYLPELDLVNIPVRTSKFRNIYGDHEGAKHDSMESAVRYRNWYSGYIGVLEYVYEDDKRVDVVFHKAA